jgi:hypothetical protein
MQPSEETTRDTFTLFVLAIDSPQRRRRTCIISFGLLFFGDADSFAADSSRTKFQSAPAGMHAVRRNSRAAVRNFRRSGHNPK